MEKIFKTLASLKFTITLFSLSMFLVLAGTLAQMDAGIWTVVDEIFRSYITKINLNLFFPRSWDIGFLEKAYIYMPGGFAIGAGLFINLTSAYMVRFKLVKNKKHLVIGAIFTVISLLFTLAIAKGYFHEEVSSTVGAAYMRVVYRLAQGLIPSVFMYAACWFLYGQKKAAVVLIHFSVILLLIAELVTKIDAVESTMVIPEGQSTSYLDNNIEYEFAVIEKTDGDNNQTTAIPMSMINSVGDTIDYESLPFTIETVEFFKNSQMSTQPAPTPGVTAGNGKNFHIYSDKVSDGLGSSKDVPAGLFKFTGRDGKDLGTRAFSLYFYANFTSRNLPNRFEEMEVDGKKYRLILRNKRSYLKGDSENTATISLINFSFDRYMGTNTPRNYSSLIRLEDPENNIDREVKIWMNNPLRFDDKTFYQQSFSQDETTTVLQVVRNSGWMLPYISCMMAATGMMIHFLIILIQFMKGLFNRESAPTGFKAWQFAISAILIIGLFYSLSRSTKTNTVDEEKEFNLDKAATIPMVYKGRTKPLHTVAQNFLVFLSESAIFKVEVKDGDKEVPEKDKVFETRPSVQFFFEVISAKPSAYEHRVFRITHPQLLEKLGLDLKRHRFRYALVEFADKIKTLESDIKKVRELKVGERDSYQTALIDFEQRLQTFHLMANSFSTSFANTAQGISQYHAMNTNILKYNPPLVIKSNDKNDWDTLSHSISSSLVKGQDLNDNTEQLAVSLFYFYDDKPAKFNEAINKFIEINKEIRQTRLGAIKSELEESQTEFTKVQNDSNMSKNDKKTKLTELSSKDHRLEGELQVWETSEKKTAFEITFNKINPFGLYHWYALGFVLCALSWLFRKPWINRCNMHFLIVIALIHTWGLFARVYISDYPPITNLYSTAIFIGWVIVIAALIIEFLFKRGIGNIIAAVCGFLTLNIADKLSLDGDTMQMMQAVLDTKFFLMTHVITINMGYAATYVAAMTGIISLVCALFKSEKENKELYKTLNSTMYGTIAFAMFFSFIGTILGGLWADDSWGRFWGWDPKENGALLIVIWCAIILHSKMAGIARSRGLALLSIFGASVTTWSWFGVNQLSIGLHSYGFTSQAAFYVMLAVGIFTGLSFIGLLPFFRWNKPKKASRTK
ncbi:cytochrome c biogenesis protein CcsA [Lentisphaera profundi]|uniref:Cytochrome c biogenesis protein CcsA n=1 Tax=Lentisphaera profundi TaxID=1658616 RepID=A0ABY7VSP9_9BACT|nr:cytochrome c biogenesis protein CcsA [Lentisphaera profundi]WDE96769.1 cytochrome c biogenesis protein CcsA [Lentisphaera profundi]